MAWPDEDPILPDAPAIGGYPPPPTGAYSLYNPVRNDRISTPDLAPPAPAPTAPVPMELEAQDYGGGGEPLPSARRPLPPTPKEGERWSLFEPEEKPPEPLTTLQEAGRGAVRGVVGPVSELEIFINRGLLGATRMLGLDETERKEKLEASKQHYKEFQEEWAGQYGTTVDAIRNAGAGGAFNHLVGKASELASGMAPIFKATRIPTIAGYMAVLMGLKASEESDGDPAATAVGAAVGALSGGAGAAVIGGPRFFTDVVGNILGKSAALGGVGAATTAAEPLAGFAATGEYKVRSWEEFLESAGLNAAAFAVPAAGQAWMRRGGAVTPPRPGVDPATTEALKLALPAPSLENRPPVPSTIEVPPTGEGQVAKQDIVPPYRPPPLPPADTPAQTPLQPRLPAPAPENRPPAPSTIEVAPTGRDQVSPFDIVPAYPRGVTLEQEAGLRTAGVEGAPATAPRVEPPPVTDVVPPARVGAAEPTPTPTTRSEQPVPAARAAEPATAAPRAAVDAVPDIVFSGDLATGLERVFWSEAAHERTPLGNAGFRPEEIAALQKAGMADADGYMSREQFGRYYEERGARLNRPGRQAPTAEPAAAPAPAAPAPRTVGEALAEAKTTGEVPRAAAERVTRPAPAEPAKRLALGVFRDGEFIGEAQARKFTDEADALEYAARHQRRMEQDPRKPLVGKEGQTLSYQAVELEGRNLSRVLEKAPAREVTKPQGTTTLTLMRRADVEAAAEARAQALEEARQRPPEPPEPEAEPEVKPLKRAAEPKGPTPEKQTLGDVAGTPRTEQSTAERLASTTTNRDEIGAAVTRDLVAGDIPVERAAQLYGTQPAGAGRRRAANDLHDYLERRVRQAEEQDTADFAKMERLAQQRLVEATKLRAKDKDTSAKLQRIDEAIETLADKAKLNETPRLREVRDQVAEHLGKKELTPEVKAGVERLRALSAARGKEPLKARATTAEKPPLHARIGEVVRNLSHRNIVRDMKRDIVNRPLLDRAREGHENNIAHSSHDYLNDIIDNPSARALTPHLVELAEQLKRVVPEVPVMSHQTGFHKTGDPRVRAEAAPGAYWPGHDMITINPGGPRAVKGAPGGMVQLMLHENLHKATSSYLENIQAKLDAGERLTPTETRHRSAIEAITRELDTLRPQRELTPGEREVIDYARSVREGHELISEALTDPEFHRVLSDHTPSPELRATMKRHGYDIEPTDSMWTVLRKTIGSIFGRGGKEDNLLDLIMRPLTEIVEHGGAFEREISAYRPVKWAALEGRAPLRARGTDRVPTDDIPDLRARSSMRPWGAFVRDNFSSPEKFAGETSRITKAAFDSGSSVLRKLTVHAAVPEEMARYNPEIAPQLEAYFDAQRSIGQSQKTFLNRPLGDRGPPDPRDPTKRQSLNDETDALNVRLQNASPKFNELTVDVGTLPNQGTTPIGVAARLGGENFRAENAHLDPAQYAVAEVLEKKFRALPPEEQALYKSLRGFNERLDYAQKSAEFQGIANRAFPAFSAAERTQLGEALRTREGLESLVNNFDSDPLMRAAGARAMQYKPLIQQIARARQAGHIEGDYFRQQRYGNWLVVAGERGVTTGTDRYQVFRFERRSQAVVAEDALKGEGVSQVVVKRADRFTRHDALHPDTIKTLNDALIKQGNLSDEARGFVQDAVAGMILRNSTRSTQSRTAMRRMGVAGASTDTARVVREDVSRTAQRVGNLLHGGEEADAFAALRKRGRDLEHGKPEGLPLAEHERIQDVITSLGNRRALIEGERPINAIVRTGTKFAFIDQLMRVMHPIYQFVEGNIRSEAHLGARFGFGRTAMEMARANAELTPTAMRAGIANMARVVQGDMRASNWDISETIRARLTGKLHPEQLEKFMDFLDREGTFQHSITMEARALARPGGFETSGNPVSRLFNNMMELYTVGAHGADALHKSATALAAFRMALAKNGGNIEASLAEIAPPLRRAAPNTATWNTPSIATQQGALGQFGPMTMQYRVQGMHIYSQMASMVKAMAHGPERAEATKALTALVALNSLAIGPLVNLMGGSIVQTMFGALDYANDREKPHDYQQTMRNVIHDTFGKPVSDFAQHGVFGLAGISAGRNIGLANASGIPELEGFDQKSYQKMIGQLAGGGSGGLVFRKMEAVQNMISGNWDRAFELSLPRFASDAYKAVRDVNVGLVDKRGRVIRGPEQTSLGGAIGTALGANVTERADWYAARTALYKGQAEVMEDRKHAMDRFLRTGDVGVIQRYNEDPQHRALSPIKMSDAFREKNALRKQLLHPEDYGRRMSARQRRALAEETAFTTP